LELLVFAGDGLGRFGFAAGPFSIGGANYVGAACSAGCYIVCISVFFEAPPPILIF